MAQAPSNEEVQRLLKESEELEKKKLKAQEKLGKEFINNGQGVIPEDVWTTLPGKQEDK